MTQIVYDYILFHMLNTGLPPTLREIASGCGLRSICSVHYQLRKLVSMGLVTMVNRHPVPVTILEYLKLFQPTQKESSYV